MSDDKSFSLVFTPLRVRQRTSLGRQEGFVFDWAMTQLAPSVGVVLASIALGAAFKHDQSRGLKSLEANLGLGDGPMNHAPNGLDTRPAHLTWSFSSWAACRVYTHLWPF